MRSVNANVLIVGAGIIGTQCALHLAKLRPDAAITIVDRNPFAYDNASCGNMGGFATCEVRPLATVANLSRAFRWALDPLAPFTLRPRHLPEFFPWMRAFITAALTPGHFSKVVRAQQTLMARAYDAHAAVVAGTPLEQLISDEGAICIYRTKQRMLRDWSTRWRLFRERGERCETLSRADLHERLPDLDARHRYAIHVPSIRHWKSPAALLRGLHDVVRNRGVRIIQGQITGVSMDGRHARSAQLDDGTEITFDSIVVAAGAWSKTICAMLGDRVPLDTERGYATTLARDRSRIRNILLFPDDEFVATPMREGLRIGGTVELAGLRAPPNFKRTQALVHLMRQYFPALEASGRDDWMGFRPSMPDGLPVIGPSPMTRNAYYAFGHGHVGVTQSAVTGRQVALALSGHPTDIDLTPFSIGRFR